VFDLSYPELIAILAGLSAGGVIGIFITTEMEARKRGIEIEVDPLESVGFPTAARAIFRSVISMIIVASVIIIIGLGILHIGGVYYLAEPLRRPFAVALLVGMGAGKLARYLLWRFR
jgi:hypothetical protein